MSHFNLAIFTLDENPNLDEIMEPFFEGNRVEPYIDMTKSELIEDARRQMQCIFETRYAEWKAHPSEYEKGVNPSHIEYLKKLPELMKRSDEELYQEAIEGYEEDDLDEDGNLLSTCNPNSKWDWYEVGGRWHGMLLLKPGKTGSRGSPGLMTPASGNYDAAYAADIDFEQMRKQSIVKLTPYEKMLTSGPYKEEYLRHCYPTERDYIQQNTCFHTYAVLTPDGAWHASGDMGWFGMSSETPEEKHSWELDYYEQFIRPAITNGWYMTIVDCHI